jgi:putative phage-type endonuclease
MNKFSNDNRIKEEFISNDNCVFPSKPLPPLRDKIQFVKLTKIEGVVQRSPEWFRLRKGMITASSVASALGKGHFNTKNDFIIKKCGKGPKFTGNIHTEWGVKYEDVAVKLYELRNNTKVHEFGIMEHPTYKFIGASPDGISVEGIMLEIKCPPKRKITGIPPRHYWMQMQIQLEVCDLEYCDFLECKITEYSGINEYLEDTKKVKNEIKSNKTLLYTKDGFEKGVVLTFNNKEGENIYFHSELCISKDEIDIWYKKTRDMALKKGLIEKKISFWRFNKISCVRVERDRKWFGEVFPQLEEVWNEVEHYKKVGCESLMKKIKKPVVEDIAEKEYNKVLNNMSGYENIIKMLNNPIKSNSNKNIKTPDFEIPDFIKNF